MSHRHHRIGGAIGQELSALWAALERQRLLPGVGQRLRETSHGVYLDVPRVCCEGSTAGDVEPPPPDPQGACCSPDDGTCQLLTEAQCLTPGVWMGADTVCEPNPCSQPPPPPPDLGSCCSFPSPSSLIAEMTCENGLTQAACLAREHAIWTQGGDCSSAATNCIYGACCTDTFQCISLSTPVACPAPHVFTANADCAAVPCAPPPPPQIGRCCSADLFDCSDATAAQCASAGGTWTGGVLCAGPSCLPVGACCNEYTGDCVVTPQGACGAPLVYQGDGTDCTGCTALTGTCCLPSGQCVDSQTQLECQNQISQPAIWTQGATCPGSCVAPPPATGSCCLPSGACSIETNAACDLLAGVWLAAGSCSPNICPQPDPVGSCCRPDFTCLESVTEIYCQQQIQQPSTWVEGGACAADCVAPPPPPPTAGRCCQPFGECSEGTLAECDALGGVFTLGATCQSACAATMGACCNDGFCTETSIPACDALPGAVWVPGQRCDPNQCPEGQLYISGCCIGGICFGGLWNDFTCQAAGGTWAGTAIGGAVETVCGMLPPCPGAPPTGRCCDSMTSACSITTEAACMGTWGGAGTDCTGNPCAPATGKCCSMMGQCLGNGWTQAQCSSASGFWYQGATCSNQYQC